MKINLSGPAWHTDGRVWVTGHIIFGARSLEKDLLVDYFREAKQLSDFTGLLSRANGQFSVVIKTDNEVWAASDRLRNFPLFYAYKKSEFVISDNCYDLVSGDHNSQLDIDSIKCFLSAGYVINKNTLIKNVNQVEAGSFVVLGDKIRSGFFYDPCSSLTTNKNIDNRAEKLENLISEVFRDHLNALHDKFLAIPLSGGFDSRLIAAMCARYHRENVICFTYGPENNPEIQPAGEVAKRLGLKWVKIIYDSELIRNFINDELFKNYYPAASNLTSMFFMQDYFAVKYLKENHIVPDNTIFIPGFSGDMIAGSHLTPAMKRKRTKDELAEMIFREFFGLIKMTGKDTAGLIGQIKSGLPSEDCDAWKVFELWDRKERQAKFVVNSARVFSYFGYDYRIPLWDNRIADFFSDIPFEMKLNKKLYDSVLTDCIFKEFNINLDREINPKPLIKTIQRFKEKIKPRLPGAVRNLFIEHKSPIFYDEITRLMIDDIGASELIKPAQKNFYNSYITQWYLAKTKTLLNS